MKTKEIPPFLSKTNGDLEENGRKRYKDENRRTEDGFARNGCENVKKKEEMGERDLDKGTFAHYILRIISVLEMVIRVKAFFHEKPPKERRKNERK